MAWAMATLACLTWRAREEAARENEVHNTKALAGERALVDANQDLRIDPQPSLLEGLTRSCFHKHLGNVRLAGQVVSTAGGPLRLFHEQVSIDDRAAIEHTFNFHADQSLAPADTT